MKKLIIIVLLLFTCGCKDINESKQTELTDKYYGHLIISNINMNLGFYNTNNPKNNVNENVTLIETNIKNTFLLAAHSGKGPLAYFNNLRYLNINDEITLIIDKRELKYKIENIRNEPKRGKINIKNEENQLILTTCNQQKKGLQLIIEAKLIN